MLLVNNLSLKDNIGQSMVVEESVIIIYSIWIRISDWGGETSDKCTVTTLGCALLNASPVAAPSDNHSLATPACLAHAPLPLWSSPTSHSPEMGLL